MLCRSLTLRENAGTFERHIDPEFAPWQLCRVALGGGGVLAAADIYPIVAGRDLTGEPAVHAVISKEVGVGLDRAEIVDPNHLDLGVLVLVGRPQDQPANAAKAVNRHPYRHGSPSQSSSSIYRSERAASATFSGVMPK